MERARGSCIASERKQEMMSSLQGGAVERRERGEVPDSPERRNRQEEIAQKSLVAQTVKNLPAVRESWV